jgi:peroxiredoxin
MNKILTIGLSVFIISLIAGCNKSKPAAHSSHSGHTDHSNHSVDSAYHPAPAFTLMDHTGKAHSLTDYSGKIIVLEWVNPECPFVKRHYDSKTMVNLANSYAAKGVVWLAVNSTNTFDQAKNAAFVMERELPYPVLNDSEGKVGRLYDAKTTPHLYVIDKKRQIAYQGAIDDDAAGNKSEKTNYIKLAIEDLLAARPVTTPQTNPYGCSVKYAQ